MKHDTYFLDLARAVSARSKDPSTKVGCVLVALTGELIATGFNGFPRSMPDNPEHYACRDEKLARTVHAEMNALIFARRDCSGATAYVWPFLPCDKCFLHLIQAGILRVVAPRNDIPRWQAAFQRVRDYATECNIEVTEL